MDRLNIYAQEAFLAFNRGSLMKLASDFFEEWIIEAGNERYEITEFEIFYYNSKTHPDPFVLRKFLENCFGRWYFRASSANLTIGFGDNWGSVHIRGLRRKSDGYFINGPQRVFEQVFEDGGNSFEPQGGISMKRVLKTKNYLYHMSPRVGLNLKEDDVTRKQKIDYYLKPYRFIRHDVSEFADKYVVALFTEKVLEHSIIFPVELTIYNKYLIHYQKGFDSKSWDEIWNVNSKLYRLARIIGYKHSTNPLSFRIGPESDLSVLPGTPEKMKNDDFYDLTT